MSYAAFLSSFNGSGSDDHLALQWAEDGRDPLPSVTAGEWLAAEGWWVRDKEHGLQFKARLMKTVPPTTVEGIERYLSRGLVKGIGPVLAKKLVGRFGSEVLSVIENRVAELQSVDGIGPKRRQRIEQAWQESITNGQA